MAVHGPVSMLALVVGLVVGDSFNPDTFFSPKSNLMKKCDFYERDAFFVRNACYVLDPYLSEKPVECKHLTGFKSSVAPADPEVITYLRIYGIVTNYNKTFLADQSLGPNNERGRTLCRYEDDLYCEGDWILHGTHCYRIFTEGMKWAEAKSACERERATLATPHDDFESQVFSLLVSKNDIVNDNWNSFVWVGIEIEDHKVMKTVDETTPNYFRWLPLGHKRLLTDAFNTKNPVVAIGASAANTGNVGQSGYYQVINGNFWTLPFICQRLALNRNGPLHVPAQVRLHFPN